MWDILSIILNIVLGLWIFYLYLENRKLKRFEIDKDIEIKKQQINECITDRWNKINGPSTILTTGNFSFAEYEIEYRNKINKLEIELKYLKRLKKYKWPFSKD